MSSQNNCKLPAYSKPLFDLIQSGQRPNNSINVFIGQLAWQKGRVFSVSYPTRTIVLPPWDDPLPFYWPVPTCDVLVHDTGYAETNYLEDLVFSLLRDGASIVRTVSPEFLLTVFHKE